MPRTSPSMIQPYDGPNLTSLPDVLTPKQVCARADACVAGKPHGRIAVRRL